MYWQISVVQLYLESQGRGQWTTLFFNERIDFLSKKRRYERGRYERGNNTNTSTDER